MGGGPRAAELLFDVQRSIEERSGSCHMIGRLRYDVIEGWPSAPDWFIADLRPLFLF